MYLNEIKEEDNRITDASKEDASSMVFFVSLNPLIPMFVSMTSSKTGIFSAIVGAFIIEFYKKLSTDPGSQTVALLQQISQQLPNSTNSTISSTANQLSPPGTAMVWVNILWLISLILSLTCAMIATLLQQWARRYIETPKSADLLRHRARVRSLLYINAELYNVPLMVEILPTFLHLSVFLFFGGLVITFHTIHKRVAIAVDVAVGLSGLAYIAMSFLPCVDTRCPYRTPISRILWYPCQAAFSFAVLCLHTCIRGLQGLVLSREQRRLVSRAPDHRRYVKFGLDKTIIDRAVRMMKDSDCWRVISMFNQLALGDRSKFLKFAASIPRHQIPDLILSTKLDSLTLGSLLVLLRSCISTYSLVNEDIRERSLLVCLHAIRHIAKAPTGTLLDLDRMRAHLANTDYMETLWWDNHSFIRTASRSICALIARKVVRKDRLEDADLRWLQGVLGKLPNDILEASVAVRDQMNFNAFVIGVHAYPQRNLPTEDAALFDLSIEDTALFNLSHQDKEVFNETLAILQINDQHYSATSDWQNQLSEDVKRIHEYDDKYGRAVFNRLHATFPFLVVPFPSVSPSPSPPPIQHFIPPVDLYPRPPSPYYGPYYQPSTPPPPPPATVSNTIPSPLVPDDIPIYYPPPLRPPPSPPPLRPPPSLRSLIPPPVIVPALPRVSRTVTPPSHSGSSPPPFPSPPTRCHVM